MPSHLTKNMIKKAKTLKDTFLSLFFIKRGRHPKHKITEQKRAEEALRQSEERYRTLVEESFDGVFVQKGRKIIFVNKRFHEMLDYNRGEMQGMDHWLVYHPDYQELTRERARARMKGEDVPSQYEVKLQRKDGSSFDGEINARAIMFGNEPGIQVWVKDITERKRSEEALRRGEESSKELAKENAIMAEIGRIISSTLNIKEVYERFGEEVRKLIPFDRIAINLISPDRQTATIAYVSGIEIPGRRQGSIIPLSGTATGETMRTRSNVIIQAENEDEMLARFPALRSTLAFGFRSIMIASLVSKDQLLGVLHFRSKEPNAYTERQLRLAERVGYQIAGAIANAQLFIERNRAEESLQESEETAKRLSQENAIVAEIGRIISSTLNIDEVYEYFAKEVAKLLSFGRIVISTINHQDFTGTTAYAMGPNLTDRKIGFPIPLNGTATGEAVHTRSSLLINEENLEEFEHRFPNSFSTLQAGFRSMIFVPMFSKDQVIAVFNLRSIKPNLYTDKDVRLAERVGHQIAGAIANAQLFMERNRAEEEQRKLILQLQDALARVKTLSGLIPICASCKKIRDDKGYWNQLETYIHDRSEAEFSHGICPECSRKLYPDFFDDEGKEKE